MIGRLGGWVLAAFVVLGACSGKSDKHLGSSSGGSSGSSGAAHAGKGGNAGSKSGNGGSASGAAGSGRGGAGGAGRDGNAGRGGGGSSGKGSSGMAGDGGLGGSSTGGMSGEAGAAGENAGAGGEGGSASDFVPTDLGARLVLWLDAGQGVSVDDGTPMDMWADQSGSGNHALQSVAERRPVFSTSGTNGLPTVKFDGASTFFELADVASLRWGTGDFTLLVVARGAPSTVTNAMIYQKSAASDPFAGPALYVNGNKPAASTKSAIQLDGTTYALSTDGIADTTARLLGGRRYSNSASARLELRLNGSVETRLANVPAIDIDAVGRSAIIGHNGYLPNAGFQAYEGELSEICAVKGTLTDSELRALEGYLLDKYELR
jgi:hypothetical protein